jgi:GT2 family glycosyltransferase
MVSVIIPTRSFKRKKNLKYLYKKIFSIQDLYNSLLIEKNIEIIAILNGNQDSELIKFIENNNFNKYAIINQNAGVSRAWNIGRQLAEGDFLLFVNDDVVIEGNSIEQMVQEFKKNEKLAIVGPQGSIWKNGEHFQYGNDKNILDVNVISGFCFMVRTIFFDEIGGFDTNYTPAGFEEIDFCFKTLQSGFQLKMLNGLKVFTEPVHGISGKKEDIIYFNNKINTVDLNEKNKKYFRKKWNF